MAKGVVDGLELVHVEIVDDRVLAQRGETALVAAAVQKVRQHVSLLRQLGVENVDQQDIHRRAQPGDAHAGLILDQKPAEEEPRQHHHGRAVHSVILPALAQHEEKKQQHAAGIGQHIDPVERLVMVDILRVDRKNEAGKGRADLKQGIGEEERVNELFVLERRHQVAAKHSDDRRCG